MIALDMSMEEFKRRIERETKRLYTETRMDGDEMRDMAHRLTGMIACAFDLPEDVDPPKPKC